MKENMYNDDGDNMREFQERMQMLLKDDYENFAEALKKDDVKALYLNLRKENAKNILNQQFITKHPYVSAGYYYDEKHYHPGRSPYFLAGLYYIQEPSAMLVAEKLPIEENDYVLDMCAAPGGKSCMVANKLGKQGLLIANDINLSRAKVLSENIERFAIEQAIVTSTDPKRFERILPGFFDKIILDAPCSGEGMFRSKDLAKETWSLEKVKECALIQKRLIDTAYKLLKPGGLLMYSTCTYSIEENEDNVRYALEHYPMELMPLDHQGGMSEGVDMPEAIRCYPHRYQGEGQFMALLKKCDDEDKHKYKSIKPKISHEALNIVTKFYQDNLNVNVPAHLYENNGHIYKIMPQFPDLGKIQILRRGLYLGEVRKNYFIPSYSLALSLKKEDFKHYYDFPNDSEEIKKWIHGEALPARNGKGFGGILVDGYPLSFYKESNAIKNLFPKGLRR
ncbi:NOL1/NOP2/sun family putative RNA methylase [Sharpea azabuensis]|nr:NOL1/NOP2/sun family putative RNA methylase [Sharpea azabuensis]SFK76725.1 NOL1/NOP2/sun family putative RNA methylase [Sharpea azabuensis]